MGAQTAVVASQDVQAKVAGLSEVFLATSPLEVVEPHTMSMTGAVCAVTSFLLGVDAEKQWIKESEGVNPAISQIIQDWQARGLSASDVVPTVVLGEWLCEWLAKETSLKVMEMVGPKVRAYGSEEYFHGPHFTLDQTERFWYIHGAEDKRAEKIRLDLKPVLEIKVSENSGAIGWISALVEIQWAALALATYLKKDPDVPGPGSKT
jgi:fructoselysine-6-P-deglycase FrlB-like protein